ncbi:hypothetical protein Bwad006_07240 [Bilophila wadsworthia]
MEKEAPQPGKDPAPPQHSEQGFAKNKNLRKGRDWGVGEGRGTPSPSSPFLPILSSCGFRR